MNNRSFIDKLMVAIFVLDFGCRPVAKEMPGLKPNIIFILTDDLGYGDMGCTGNPWIKTPNLDSLHGQSVRFSNFHTGTTCAPTRASLMTGKYNNFSNPQLSPRNRDYSNLSILRFVR